MLKERIAEVLSGAYGRSMEAQLPLARVILTAIAEAAKEGMPLIDLKWAVPIVEIDGIYITMTDAQRQSDIDWLKKQAKGE